MTISNLCPCDLGQTEQKTYATCCQPFHLGKAHAPTPEALLRSRYSAFAKHEIDYILKTHHSETIQQIKRDEVEEWAKNSQWLGLTLLDKKDDPIAPIIAMHVRYEEKGKIQDHYEKSIFKQEKIDGVLQWKFFDAEPLGPQTLVRTEPKINRNDPCPCNSGKKYKKCCG
jgi:SEC-C motif-containing protein